MSISARKSKGVARPPRAVTALLAAVLVLVVAPSASAVGWLPHSLNFPSGVSQEKLFGVGCNSTTACTAAGQDYNGSWGAHAESGWGSGWVFQTGVTRSYLGTSTNVLNGSSCVSATTFCMTVGSYGASGSPVSMAQQQSAGSWNVYNTGLSGGTMSELTSVSCRSTTWCMAAGWKMISGTGRPFAMGFNGSTWSDTSAVTPSDAVFRGISCPTTTYCLAVGYNGPKAPLAEVWNGFSWTVTPTPSLPSGGNSYILNSVSCVSATWCLAVGSYQATGGTTGPRAVASLWNGTSWTVQPNLPWPTGTGAYAYGISCLSTTWCEAVGETNATQPLAAQWTGSTWSGQTVTAPPGASNATLRGVTCVSTVRCEASGWSLFSGTPTGLIETFS